MIYYLPGCDVRRNHPEAVSKMQDYIAKQSVGVIECCRKNLSFVCDDDEIIQTCTLCDMVLRERVPQAKITSIYEYLLRTGFDFPDHSGRVMTVQDCFRTKHNPVLLDSIRECLRRMHIEIVEMDSCREKTEFCGVWLNNPIAPDLPALVPNLSERLESMRHLLPAEEQKKKMEEWVSYYKTDEIAVYCNGCERGVKLGGGHAVHMIELLSANL